MRRRTFEEMITYFNQTVSEMDIDRKYKMILLGIVTALLQKHDEDVAEIVRCKDCLMHGVCRFEQGLGLNGFCSQAERKVMRMRAIDGDALRDRLQNLADDEWNQSTTTSWAEAFCECANIVEDAPTIEPEPHWIPCSERLPEDEQNVLVTYKTTDKIHPCQYHDDGSRNPWYSYIDQCRAYMNVVTAWMPLPETYREGEG